MILTSNHHSPESKVHIESLLTHGLHWAIEQFDEVVMFADTWKDPAPLKRAWCVWELYGVSKAKKNLVVELALSAEEQDDFLQTLTHDSDAGRLIFVGEKSAYELKARILP